jgi:hypothetical protein
MPSDTPPKVASISYRTGGVNIMQIKVNLTNGESSPIFAASNTNGLSDLKTVEFGDTS